MFCTVRQNKHLHYDGCHAHPKKKKKILKSIYKTVKRDIPNIKVELLGILKIAC